MNYFAACFTISLLVTFVIIRSSMRHGGFSADHDLTGPQKFHSQPVPRIGGAAIMLAVLSGAALAHYTQSAAARSLYLLIICSVPAFTAGIVEDVTKTVPPRWRLFATAMSACLAAWLLNAVVTKTAIPGVDFLVQYFPIAALTTVFVVTGVANAVNIIDGFNGLASMCVLIMILALAYVAFQVSDGLVLTATLIIAGSVLGFFVWNFPAGLIFLGDGGAYLLGYLLAELSVLLIHRNSSVSPIFPLLLCAYPIFETIFTIYRRKVVRGVATGLPDGIHLHTLIHRRLVRWTDAKSPERRRLRRRNSMTSPYLWLLCLISVIPGVLWWNNTFVLSCVLLTFMAFYVWLYARIVRFRTPRWLIFRRTH